MKRIIPVIMAFVLVSCVSRPKYVVQGDVVTYSYWTFSFGQRQDTLVGADAATFRQATDWLGYDAKHVYYKDRLVPGVDVASLETVHEPLFRDKNDYYYQTVPMHVADRASFKVIKWFEDDFWAKDSHCAYYDSVRIVDADLPTFTVIEMSTAKDKLHVYYFGRVLPLADPATFEILGQSVYSRDKAHIWCCDELLEDADVETFTVDDLNIAHDKNGTFRWEKRDSVP